MDFTRFIEKDRRLLILKMLEQEPDYSLNDSVIQTALDGVGHGVSHDSVRTDLAWLNEQGLITLSEMNPMVIAKIKTRGIDVALGRVIQPGVKRPQPGA